MAEPEAALPEAMRRYLERALPQHGSAPRQVLIAQHGQMWQKPGARATRFTALERLAVEEVAFSWRARFPLAGPLAIAVVDRYAAGEGAVEVRLLGVPLQRQRGPETAAGEALRYLAELPWAPHAIARNRELEWRAAGERAVEVAASVRGERLAVTLELDEAGDVVRASAAARQRRTAAGWIPTPWGGEFGAYKLLGGVRIPTSAEVFWELGGDRFVYWRGTVTSLELLDHPFERAPRVTR
jgi:hypothetical protein